MTRERYRFAAVLIGLIAQIVGGVLAFGLAPHNIFADIDSNDLAQACLRLAVYSNISMALIVAMILRYVPEPRLLRWLAAGGALYHLFAGFDGLRTALGFNGVNLVGPIFGPAIFHCLMFLILFSAVLIPEREPAKDRKLIY